MPAFDVQPFLTIPWIDARLAWHAIATTEALSEKAGNSLAMNLLLSGGKHRIELLCARGAEAPEIRAECSKVIRSVLPLNADRGTLESSLDWLTQMAFVVGDPKLSAELARFIQPPPLNSASPDKKAYFARQHLLQHVLAGNRAIEDELVEWLEPRYMNSDFPKALIEFPLAVNRGDETLLLNAVKKTSDSFKRKWDPDKLRAWFDAHPKKWNGNWDGYMNAVKGQLLALRWFVSWWALAWLNVARTRGMVQIFKAEKNFSDWIPLRLCSDP